MDLDDSHDVDDGDDDDDDEEELRAYYDGEWEDDFVPYVFTSLESILLERMSLAYLA